jgi:hypothetical protein
MPLLYLATNFEGEKHRLIEILRIRMLNEENVAILMPTKRKVYGFATAMREAGLEVETPKEMDFTNNIPKIMTYFNAKGLTFDTILMPRLVSGSFFQVETSAKVILLVILRKRSDRRIS